MTLNIDDETAARLNKAANASGVSAAEFVAHLLRQSAVLQQASRDFDALPPLPSPRGLGCHVENPRRLLAEMDADENRQRFGAA